ncbi:hypothetical protein Taro_030082 [Colocasia esculenta]|uniref:Peptidase M1 leukotriene A4 hydrolase/aminopeptidase C-terminal domain-containing protein n=1 Tax=Colocasia esculenta TaxID=4460 RepID=A0A843VKK4_COLES|nr:hypothetical protein [Colocasia esculenta]
MGRSKLVSEPPPSSSSGGQFMANDQFESLKAFLMDFRSNLQQQIGRDAIDQFLKKYIATIKFQSLDTETFVDFLKANVPGIEHEVDLETWVNGTGIPSDATEPVSSVYSKIVSLAKEFTLGRMPGEEDVAALDPRFSLAESRDWEVKVAFLEWAFSSGCKEYFTAVEKALKEVGRMKYLRPLLYTVLVQGAGKEEGKVLAQRLFAEARQSYHPIAQGVV